MESRLSGRLLEELLASVEESKIAGRRIEEQAWTCGTVHHGVGVLGKDGVNSVRFSMAEWRGEFVSLSVSARTKLSQNADTFLH